MHHLRVRRTLIVPVVIALGLVLGGAACANDRTDPSAPSASQTNSAGNGSTYQRVEELLEEVEEAFDAPARTSSAGNTDKTVDNMQVVADRLMQAHELAPYRNDLLFSAASAQIARKDVAAALELYRAALTTAPNDIDAQTYLAGWSRFLGRRDDADDFIARLRALEPARADQLTAMFATIDRGVSTPLTEALPALPEAGLAIVTLGYALHEDGSMDDILIDRLRQTKAAAQRWPNAPIVVTGGVEQSGRTEGESMKEWLVDNGVAADRIHDENFARSTVENASYGVEVLASLRATRAVIISSASHIRRALTVFQLAAEDTLGKDFVFAGTGSADKPLAELTVATPDELLSIYRDAFSAIGMWSYRSAPLLRQ